MDSSSDKSKLVMKWAPYKRSNPSLASPHNNVTADILTSIVFELLSLVWENIADLSVFCTSKKEYNHRLCCFPEEVEEFSRKIYAEAQNVEIIYVVLWVERKELLRRDALRIKEHQMGVRCLELMTEFEIRVIDKRFFYNTTDLQPSNLEEIYMNIKENPSFKF